MSLRVVFEGLKVLKLSEVRRALGLAKEGSRGYEELWPVDHTIASVGERSELPDLYRNSHLRIDDICVTGRLDMESGWEKRWLNIMELGKPMLATPGRLVFCYDYQERNCKYRGPAYGEDIGIWLEGKKCLFHLTAPGEDYGYRRKVITDVIERFDLPLAIKDRDGSYVLRTHRVGSCESQFQPDRRTTIMRETSGANCPRSITVCW